MSRNQLAVAAVLGMAVVLTFCCLCVILLTYLVAAPFADLSATPEPPVTAGETAPTTETTPPMPPTPTATAAQTPTSTATIAHSPTQIPTPEPTDTHTPAPTNTSTMTPTPLPPTATSTPSVTEAMVSGIIDGDTIEVQIAGQTYRLRYIGIECPEAGQYGCSQATEANRQLVEGKTVRLERDVSETDQYGRLLRYVYVGDLFVNAELVRRGYATAWTYPPDVAFSDLFVQLESEARDGGRGLWAAPTPTSGSTWNCHGNLYNCGDFSSCAQVMSYWNACPGDPSRLDGDRDGVPCESLCR